MQRSIGTKGGSSPVEAKFAANRTEVGGADQALMSHGNAEQLAVALGLFLQDVSHEST